MTDHHVPKSKRVSASKKSLQGFNWSLDQELKEKTNSANPPRPPRSGGSSSGSGGSSEINYNREDSQEGILRPKIKAWFEQNGISTINFFLTNYSTARLIAAIEDYERATEPKKNKKQFIPNNPTRFFRSLLQPIEQKTHPTTYSELDPNKFVKGKYGNMVQR